MMLLMLVSFDAQKIKVIVNYEQVTFRLIQNPCPYSKLLIRASTGHTQTLRGRSGSEYDMTVYKVEMCQ